ncbi:MAG: pyridoxine 5'-phosphate synthase [bacterium]|jgi:pyridoxine 5-phosphate synthase|nr:pyridoxine 5'-phosphate synthase [candidate division KSB1 bacterium]MDH7560574.1 pyridoxine 5'-phosphate synthase [bacterium]
MLRLGVNIDLVAVIRADRRGKEPNPVAAALQAEVGGADGVVATLREDRRYLTERDMALLKETVTTHFNLRVAASEEMAKRAVAILPDMATLIPPLAQGVVPSTGLDVAAGPEPLEDLVATLRSSNIVVAARIEPDLRQVKAAAHVGVDYVELNTTPLAMAQDLDAQTEQLEKLRAAALAASKLGLGVSAAGGLNYQNVREVAKIPQIEEVNIGHALVCRALLVGLAQAVRDMTTLLRECSPPGE